VHGGLGLRRGCVEARRRVGRGRGAREGAAAPRASKPAVEALRAPGLLEGGALHAVGGGVEAHHVAQHGWGEGGGRRGRMGEMGVKEQVEEGSAAAEHAQGEPARQRVGRRALRRPARSPARAAPEGMPKRVLSAWPSADDSPT
jgi:hypothetical protein